jgi:bifunctional DNase/RNase
MVEVKLEDIAVSGQDDARFLVLLSTPTGTLLPIVIDALQALSIASGRSNERPDRPMTHDLMLSMLGILDATLERVEITDLVDGTYFAVVVVERHGVRFDMDARPSDALALAVRAGCPIWVSEKVLEASGMSDDVGEGGGFEA